jgi:hypothetical protein
MIHLSIKFYLNAKHVICDNFTESNNVENDVILVDQPGIYVLILCYMYINKLGLWFYNVLVYSALDIFVC